MLNICRHSRWATQKHLPWTKKQTVNWLLMWWEVGLALIYFLPACHSPSCLFDQKHLAHEGCWPNIPSSKMDDHISLSLFSSFPILDPQKLIELTQFIYQLTSGLNFGNWWYTLALIVSMWLVMLLQNYQRILIKQTFQCSAKHQPLIFIVSLVTL